MHVHGVDFSGARDGGSGGIRVAHRWLGDATPVTSIGRMHRGALREAILDSRSDGEPHLWLLDAPFAVAIPTLEDCGVEVSWQAMTRWFAERGNPRDWRRAVRARTRKEVRRLTDRISRTPLAPMNLRVFKQTWTAVTEILVPLAEAGVRVEPLAGSPSSVVVCEGCPASVLARMGAPVRGYKGGGEPPREKRAEILKLLARRGVRVSSSVAEECVQDEKGDALDAVVLCALPWQGPVPAIAAVEGWVY
ncbi:MAG: DUF429 domain-containing protein [Phycisphaerales bacterium]|nr:DUF429 domain-containing protein [Phycisphaerales bacterium]